MWKPFYEHKDVRKKKGRMVRIKHYFHVAFYELAYVATLMETENTCEGKVVGFAGNSEFLSVLSRIRASKIRPSVDNVTK